MDWHGKMNHVPYQKRCAERYEKDRRVLREREAEGGKEGGGREVRQKVGVNWVAAENVEG